MREQARRREGHAPKLRVAEGAHAGAGAGVDAVKRRPRVSAHALCGLPRAATHLVHSFALEYPQLALPATTLLRRNMLWYCVVVTVLVPDVVTSVTGKPEVTGPA